MKTKYKPGPGWKYLGSAVYEKYNHRIHAGGFLIRFPNGSTIDFIDHKLSIHRFIKVTGGNRKRGLMAFANYFFIPDSITDPSSLISR